MPLTLKQSQAVGDLAGALYSFLPGKPHPYGDQRLSFPAVAARIGVSRYWSSVGSKEPAIAQFLTGVLEHEPARFCPLMIELVRSGMIYRRKDPITQEELANINEIIHAVGFKIPELHEREFVTSLPHRDGKPEVSSRAAADAVDVERLKQLDEQLRALMTLAAQPRGYAFERFLDELFETFHLSPRGSFRIRGEQIDGSFELQGDTYLVEARWQDALVDQAGIGGLHLKIEGKATWSRGLFISWSGFSDDGLEAYARGKRASVICMNGLELWHVVQGKLDLRQVIAAKARRAAEANVAFAPVRDLFPKVI